MTAFEDEPMLGHLCHQTDHLLRTVSGLTDGDVRQPSLLPGWTRGHVLTHLARNADGFANVVRTAITGEVTPMYVSVEVRDADIEAGANRSASELEADVESSAERLLALLAELPAERLDVQVPSGRGPLVAVANVPWGRTREVVYHHADLDAGFSFDAVTEPLLRAGLAECISRLAAARPGASLTVAYPDGSTEQLVIGDGAVQVSGPAAAALAWLTGRSDGAALDAGQQLPSLPSWG
jgi:maleylpyruvate isomerase